MRLFLPVSGFWLLKRLIQLYRVGNEVERKINARVLRSIIQVNGLRKLTRRVSEARANALLDLGQVGSNTHM